MEGRETARTCPTSYRCLIASPDGGAGGRASPVGHLDGSGDRVHAKAPAYARPTAAQDEIMAAALGVLQLGQRCVAALGHVQLERGCASLRGRLAGGWRRWRTPPCSCGPGPDDAAAAVGEPSRRRDASRSSRRHAVLGGERRQRRCRPMRPAAQREAEIRAPGAAPQLLRQRLHGANCTAPELGVCGALGGMPGDGRWGSTVAQRIPAMSTPPGHSAGPPGQRTGQPQQPSTGTSGLRGPQPTAPPWLAYSPGCRAHIDNDPPELHTSSCLAGG